MSSAKAVGDAVAAKAGDAATAAGEAAAAVAATGGRRAEAGADGLAAEVGGVGAQAGGRRDDEVPSDGGAEAGACQTSRLVLEGPVSRTQGEGQRSGKGQAGMKVGQNQG